MQSILSEKSNLETHSGAGKRALRACPLPSEIGIPLVGCLQCPVRDTHGVCWGLGTKLAPPETAGQEVPEANRVTWADLNRLWSALEWLSSLAWGEIRSVYNAGTGSDNAYQYVDYEITSIDDASNTVSLRGRDPRRIEVAISSRDLDSYLGGGPAIVHESIYICLPVGSFVEFMFPSCKHINSELPIMPRVISVSPPSGPFGGDDSEFSIVVSSACESALLPDDGALEWNGPFMCRIWFSASRPPFSPRWERPFTRRFENKVLVMTRDEIVAHPTPDAIRLTNSDSNDGLVYPPKLVSDSISYVFAYIAGGETEAVDMQPLLTQTQLGEDDYVSTIDLSFAISDTSVERVKVSYLIEAASFVSSGDVFELISKCSNCFHDPTGSYVLDGDERCLAASDLCEYGKASQLSSFAKHCFQPNCSKFVVGSVLNCINSVGETSSQAEPRMADWRDGSVLSRFWMNVDWKLVQSMPGASGSLAFYLDRPSDGGPSLGELCGLLLNSVPSGLYPTSSTFRQPMFGKRVEDSEAGTHSLAFGAFILRDEWEFGNSPPDGVISDTYADWDSDKELTGRVPANSTGLKLYPSCGAGTVGLSSLTHSGSCYSSMNFVTENSEVFITGVLLSALEYGSDDSVRLRATLEAM